jgi:hypothetical protein
LLEKKGQKEHTLEFTTIFLKLVSIIVQPAEINFSNLTANLQAVVDGQVFLKHIQKQA